MNDLWTLVEVVAQRVGDWLRLGVGQDETRTWNQNMVEWNWYTVEWNWHTVEWNWLWWNGTTMW